MGDQKHKTGERFREIAEVLFHGNLAELARNLNMTPQAFNQYVHNERKPGTKILQRLMALRVNINWFLSGIGPMLRKETESITHQEFEEKLMEFEKDALTVYLTMMVPEPNYAVCLKNISTINKILSEPIKPIKIETGSGDFQGSAPASETDELTQTDKPTNHEQAR